MSEKVIPFHAPVNMLMTMRDEYYRFMVWLIANHPEVYDEYDWEAKE